MILRKFIVSVSIFLIPFLIFLKQYLLLSLLIRINIFKKKGIKTNAKPYKNILVCTKAAGLKDLVYALNSQKKNNFVIYELSRPIIKTIFNYYLRNQLVDYNYHLNDKNLSQKKERYRKTLTKIIFNLKKLIDIDLIVSFNAFYYSEVEMRPAAINNSIKFLVLHKENIYSPIENEILLFIYKKLNSKFDGSKLLVYTESEKKLFLKSRLVDKNKISVIGIPRTDGAISYKKIVPKNKILYFLIEENRGLPSYLLNIINRTSKLPANILKRIKKFSNEENYWKKMSEQTENYLINFAKKNPKFQIVFKGKVGVHEQKFQNINLPNNIKLVKSGTGEKYLKDCKIVIAFNTTAMFETIAAGRELIIPNYGYDKRKFEKSFLINMHTKYLANNLAKLDNKINKAIRKKYIYRNYNFYEKKILDYYIGNFKKDASKKLIKNIKQLLNKDE